MLNSKAITLTCLELVDLMEILRDYSESPSTSEEDRIKALEILIRLEVFSG